MGLLKTGDVVLEVFTATLDSGQFGHFLRQVRLRLGQLQARRLGNLERVICTLCLRLCGSQLGVQALHFLQQSIEFLPVRRARLHRGRQTCL